tara:strand:- start:494 stop:1675 length:1182 start_codon:yes stop_codon:yes gene_type:complete
MVDYLDRIGAGKILISGEPLSFDWTPPVLIGRDVQLSDLASIFNGIENHNVSKRAVIIGNVGSGKTVLARRFCMDVINKLERRRRIEFIHINCRNHPSSSQIIQQIIQSLDPGHPDRGFSTGELIQSIRRNINTNGRHLILILDEVDVLIRRDSSDLIYKLLRIDEGKDDSGTLSLVLVSQDLTIFNLFEGAIKSRLGESNILRLPSYKSEDLVSITKQRYEASCKPNSIEGPILEKIGDYAEDSGGDARMAIELLEAAIARAEKDGRSKLILEDVRPSENTSASIEPSVIHELSKHEKLVLLGICRRLKRSDNISSGDARKMYELVCEEFSITPRGYTTFWKHLKSLEIGNLISSISSTTNLGRGRTQIISMPNLLPATIESNLETDLLRGR